MKKHSVVILLTIASVFVAHTKEKSLESRFELVRDLDGTFTTGQRGRIRVTDEIFGQSRNFPNDLRVFGAAGAQWPFFLHTPKETDEIRKVDPEILNRSFVTGREPYLQFDLVIPQVDGKVPVHNRMELVTSGHDFVRRVEVFTGNSGQSSGRMAAGYLIDFSRQRNARNQSIRYPDSDSGRLHVRIYTNARAANEPFELRSARLYYRAVKEVDREGVHAVSLAVPDREQEKGALTKLFDLGETDRPVEFITFEVENDSYARCVSIYGRNSDHEPWRWVGGGEIHALAGDKEGTVKFHAKERFLKVHVFHYDDQPLAIDAIKLEAISRYLVFEAVTAGRAGLYFRAWDIKAPRYDLKGRIKPEELAGLPLVQTRDTKPNSMAKAQPWRKYSKGLGGLAVAGVSLLVIWIIVSMLRQQRAADQ
jgi:hypothetical protein